jgi:hypothetical protein
MQLDIADMMRVPDDMADNVAHVTLEDMALRLKDALS